jgi:hypothetical protein
MKILAGIIGGLIIAILGAIEISLAGAMKMKAASSLAVIAFFVLLLAGIAMAVMAPSTGKAWRRLLITAAVFSFLLPLSAIVFTGSSVAQSMDAGGQYSGAAAAGAAIGGTFVSGFMGILGFFLGAIFLIVGLLVGREEKIIYVRDEQPVVGRPTNMVEDFRRDVMK